MLFPIRCFSCNKVVANFEEKYKSLLKEGMKPCDALNILEIRRICCRRMFLGHVDIIDQLLLFPRSASDFQGRKNSTKIV